MSQNNFIKELSLLGIYPTEYQLKQLEKYYLLLIEYNKVMNLTGITEKNEVYLKHFYDSLTIIKVIDLNSINNLCDIGTGAGFPGVVLKILFPHLKVSLVDSLKKRIDFLNIVINQLNLQDIETFHERIEDFSIKNEEKYDLVVSRAVAPLNILLEIGIKQVKINGYFIAMKGNKDTEPNTNKLLNRLNLSLDQVLEFKLPIENSNRTLFKFKKIKQTPPQYPRKYNIIKKKPL